MASEDRGGPLFRAVLNATGELLDASFAVRSLIREIETDSRSLSDTGKYREALGAIDAEIQRTRCGLYEAAEQFAAGRLQHLGHALKT